MIGKIVTRRKAEVCREKKKKKRHGKLCEWKQNQTRNEEK